MDGEKLIIIGNGFDLQCGLKSSYKDFLKSRIAQTSNNVWVDILSNKDVKLQSFWGDIESLLDKILNENDLLISQLLFFMKLINQVNGNSEEENYELFLDEWIEWSDRLEQDKSLALAVTKILFNVEPGMSMDDSLEEMNMLMGIYGVMSPEDYIAHYASEPLFHLREFLLAELRGFEELFVKYLRKEVKRNVQYKQNARDLILKLMNISQERNSSKETSIISFNYTKPFTQQPALNVSVNNIHGTLSQKNIIFGIFEQKASLSDSMVMDSKRIDEFSKLKRKMRLLPYVQEWKVPEKISNIIIYGHSLSSADDSYFFALFDIVDLYNSEVILTFAYTRYNPGMSLDPFPDALQRLLEEYANSLDTKRPGRVFINKLMFENRIKFVEIK